LVLGSVPNAIAAVIARRIGHSADAKMDARMREANYAIWQYAVRKLLA
jgi:hypothetical protein